MGHGLVNRIDKDGNDEPWRFLAGANTRVAIKALALASLGLMLLGLALMETPFSLAHCLLLNGVALALLAVHFSLLPEPGVAERATSANDHAEREIERLQDAHWQLSDNEARYREQTTVA